MNLKSTRIRTSSGSKPLWRHLNKTAENEEVIVLRGSEQDLRDGMKDAFLENITYGLRHLAISPAEHEAIDADQARQIAEMYADEIGARSDAITLVEHKKPRQAGGYERHWHAVLPEWNPVSQRVANSRMTFIQNEFVARRAEIQLGQPLTKGRHNRAVAHEMTRRGLHDEARQVIPLTQGPPAIADYGDKQHQRAKRRGRDMRQVRQVVADAWSTAADRDALEDALEDQGLALQQGEKAPWIVVDEETGSDLGALDRLAGKGVKRGDVRAFLEPQTQEVTDVVQGPAEARSERSDAGPDSGSGRAAGVPDPEAGPGRERGSDGEPAGRNVDEHQRPGREAEERRGSDQREDRSAGAAEAVREKLKRSIRAFLLRRRARLRTLQADDEPDPGPGGPGFGP